MQAFATPKTILRETVIEQLSRIRYNGKAKKIDPATLWRWCKLAAIQTGLSEYSLEQVAVLAQVAQWKRQGYPENQIKVFLGEKSNGSSQKKQHQQQQGFRAESGPAPPGVGSFWDAV
jgi:hypothetical protein